VRQQQTLELRKETETSHSNSGTIIRTLHRVSGTRSAHFWGWLLANGGVVRPAFRGQGCTRRCRRFIQMAAKHLQVPAHGVWCRLHPNLEGAMFMLRHMSPIRQTHNLTGSRRGAFALVGAVAFVLAGSAYAQGVQFELVGGSTTGGGGTSSGGVFSMTATMGETASGPTSGGDFDCSTGVLGSTDEGPLCAETDVDCNGSTDGSDLGIVLINWGPCPGGSVGCEGDIDRTGDVDAGDIAMVMLGWGP